MRPLRLAETHPRWSTTVITALHTYSFVFSTTLPKITIPSHSLKLLRFRHKFSYLQSFQWTLKRKMLSKQDPRSLFLGSQEGWFTVFSSIMKLRAQVFQFLQTQTQKFNTSNNREEVYKSILGVWKSCTWRDLSKFTTSLDSSSESPCFPEQGIESSIFSMFELLLRSWKARKSKR